MQNATSARFVGIQKMLLPKLGLISEEAKEWFKTRKGSLILIPHNKRRNFNCPPVPRNPFELQLEFKNTEI